MRSCYTFRAEITIFCMGSLRPVRDLGATAALAVSGALRGSKSPWEQHCGRVPRPSKKVIKMEGIKRLYYRSSMHKERVSCFGEKSVPWVRSEPGVGKSVNSLLPVEYAKQTRSSQSFDG